MWALAGKIASAWLFAAMLVLIGWALLRRRAETLAMQREANLWIAQQNSPGNSEE